MGELIRIFAASIRTSANNSLNKKTPRNPPD